MKTFITGANGFLGNLLYKYFLEKGYEVFGSSRKKFVKLDILNYQKLSDTLKKIKPKIIVHLAAQSYPQQSWLDPQDTLKTNILGSMNVLEAVRHNAPKAKVLMIGSSASYGTQIDTGPINENNKTNPNSPYGISKLAQDHLSYLYHKKYKLNIICARPFFLIGPGKVGDVCSDFAKGIINIEKKKNKSLTVGNLNIVRDFLDYRDGISAMDIILEKGNVGEIYNICGGKGYSLKDIISKMSQIVGFSIKLNKSSSLIRKIDEKIVIGDNKKLVGLGWKKKYDINYTLFDIINFWRHQ